MPAARIMTCAERAKRQARIAEVYASGMTSEDTALLFGVSGHWVRSIARLYGVSRGYSAPKRRRSARTLPTSSQGGRAATQDSRPVR